MNEDARASSQGWRRVFFQVGWWILIGVTGLFAVYHVVGAVAFSLSDEEQARFIALAALQALSVIVLLIPYRHLEWWAWWATWIPIAALAAAGFVLLGSIGGVYLGLAAIVALAQLVTITKFGAQASPSD
ncbi:hypothetical protein ACH3VR_22995 [Microbacterium sp. B2969]|uniref:Uncharacterized protein n=1 Tax=Microbacterium alkaliflavum TaxID=3248839 RepID=A0ABW7QGB8_9MICO